MRRTLAMLSFTAILASAALPLVMVPNGTSRAAAGSATKTFIIPASDGYGVADCLASGTECGQVVASAWCEAQGFAQAASFGLAAPEDVTGSVELASTAPTERPIAITCAN